LNSMTICSCCLSTYTVRTLVFSHEDNNGPERKTTREKMLKSVHRLCQLYC
jgi:hypothetical protein